MRLRGFESHTLRHMKPEGTVGLRKRMGGLRSWNAQPQSRACRNSKVEVVTYGRRFRAAVVE